MRIIDLIHRKSRQDLASLSRYSRRPFIRSRLEPVDAPSAASLGRGRNVGHDVRSSDSSPNWDRADPCFRPAQGCGHHPAALAIFLSSRWCRIGVRDDALARARSRPPIRDSRPAALITMSISRSWSTLRSSSSLNARPREECKLSQTVRCQNHDSAILGRSAAERTGAPDSPPPGPRWSSRCGNAYAGLSGAQWASFS